MINNPKLIYCAGGNIRFAEIAIESNFLYGSQLPATTYYNVFFVDQNWKKPNKQAYIEAIKTRNPYLATVLDIESEVTYTEALDWAEEIAPHVGKLILIPKIEIDLPLKIGGKEIIIGYSVPTKYGGTPIPIECFTDRKLHLLGGSPHAQMEIFMKYPNSIYSVDGNYHQKMAIRFNSVWELGKKRAYGT